MTKFNQSDSVHRHAIWTVHNEKCYMCNEPVSFLEIEIDHVIPQSYGKDQEKLVQLMKEYGLEASFDLNDFENLLPACRRCNRSKSDTPWNSSGLGKLYVSKALQKAPAVKELIAKGKADRRVTRTMVQLQEHSEREEIPDEIHEMLRTISHYQVSAKRPKDKSLPLHITKEILIPGKKEMLDDKTCRITWTGPFTLSAEPNGSSFKGPAICKFCGGRNFNNESCASCKRKQ